MRKQTANSKAVAKNEFASRMVRKIDENGDGPIHHSMAFAIDRIGKAAYELSQIIEEHEIDLDIAEVSSDPFHDAIDSLYAAKDILEDQLKIKASDREILDIDDCSYIVFLKNMIKRYPRGIEEENGTIENLLKQTTEAYSVLDHFLALFDGLSKIYGMRYEAAQVKNVRKWLARIEDTVKREVSNA